MAERKTFRYEWTIGLDCPHSLYMILDEIEDEVILSAYELAEHNKTQAAKMIGLNRSTFFMKLRSISDRAKIGQQEST